MCLHLFSTLDYISSLFLVHQGLTIINIGQTSHSDPFVSEESKILIKSIHQTHRVGHPDHMHTESIFVLRVCICWPIVVRCSHTHTHTHTHSFSFHDSQVVGCHIK